MFEEYFGGKGIPVRDIHPNVLLSECLSDMGQVLFLGGLFPVVPEDYLPGLMLREAFELFLDCSDCLLHTQDTH